MNNLAKETVQIIKKRRDEQLKISQKDRVGKCIFFDFRSLSF